MRYLALRRRADVLLAGLGRDGTQTLHIVGGMPPAPNPTLNPVEPAPDTGNNGVYPNVDLGSKTK
jgi:hypothetical protein